MWKGADWGTIEGVKDKRVPLHTTMDPKYCRMVEAWAGDQITDREFLDWLETDPQPWRRALVNRLRVLVAAAR